MPHPNTVINLHAAPPPNARTRTPADSTRRRWARMAEADATARQVDAAAREAAHADGLRAGYRQGWRWGAVCGGVAGALLATLGWAAWLTYDAPNAAPPSAPRWLATRT